MDNNNQNNPSNPPQNQPGSSNPPVENKPQSQPQDNKGGDWQAKLEGKSTSELAQMYGEAQKKLGEMSGEVERSRKDIQDMNVILAAISDDPEREKQVRDWLITYMDKTNGPKKTTPEKKEESQVDFQVQDVRKTQESTILGQFESKYGIDKLEKDKKDEFKGKLYQAIWKIADPFGKFQKWEEVSAAIPVSKLSDVLERAYRDVKWPEIEERLTTAGGDIAMGPISSAGLPSEETVKLTVEEENTAKKLGIAPEKYLERKKELSKKK